MALVPAWHQQFKPSRVVGSFLEFPRPLTWLLASLEIIVRIPGQLAVDMQSAAVMVTVFNLVPVVAVAPLILRDVTSKLLPGSRVLILVHRAGAMSAHTGLLYLHALSIVGRQSTSRTPLNATPAFR
ncbi:hypothetical protein AC579_6961 [Pseudocercospora musae]|uniref:Uncharacterized protein n=1 Tax=Pseudocercospora musae TaxID=113226 RepID=A0A139IN42_9PEZI|nr:hypothetical protein AC579_6961 [Pseudocercospora musae]